MPEYISRDAAKAACGCERATKYGNKTPVQLIKSYSTLMLYEIADAIDDVPAADVVPVVRCKDCDCAPNGDEGDGYTYCHRYCEVVPPMHFCGYGTRMDKEATK